MVLAIGNLMDVHQPAYNIEAEKCHQLARAALFQSSLFDEPTISAVQALVSIQGDPVTTLILAVVPHDLLPFPF